MEDRRKLDNQVYEGTKMQANGKLEMLVDEFRATLKLDIRRIINESPIEEGMEKIKDEIYKMYENFLSNSPMGTGIALDRLVIGKNNIDKFLQAEYQNIKDEKVDRVIRMILNFENSREDKYKWTNREKRNEEANLEVEYKDNRPYSSKVDIWISQMQENLQEVENMYKISCNGYGSIAVAEFNKELVSVLHRDLDWDNYNSVITKSMSRVDNKTIKNVLDKYEEYIKLVEQVSKDARLQDELVSDKNKRDEFTKSLRVENGMVNINKAIKQVKDKEKEKDNQSFRFSNNLIE